MTRAFKRRSCRRYISTYQMVYLDIGMCPVWAEGTVGRVHHHVMPHEAMEVELNGG